MYENGIKEAVDDWLNENEGFSLRRERMPEDSLPWLYEAAKIGAAVIIDDKVEGLLADLDAAIEVAWGHGAHDWVGMNYPEHYKKFVGCPSDIVIDYLGGNCPVQAEGTIAGKEFYFRARGDRWSICIGGNDVVMKPEYSYTEKYGSGAYDAGWMDEETARGFIYEAAERYLKEMKNGNG
jgi:hypothetical protein